MREQPSHATFPPHASAATQHTDTSSVNLKNIKIMQAGGGIDRRSHMVYLHAWTFYLLTFAVVLSIENRDCSYMSDEMQHLFGIVPFDLGDYQCRQCSCPSAMSSMASTKTSWVTTSYLITYTGSLLFDCESVQRLTQTSRLPDHHRQAQ